MSFLELNDGRKELYQWDTGRTAAVSIECDIVHFANLKYGETLAVRVKSGSVDVPNKLLMSGADIYCWAFVEDVSGSFTKQEQVFGVNKRPKPSEYVYTETEVVTIETEVNKALQKAKESGEFKGEKGDKGDKGDRGEKGESGADGKTPTKGVDYFDGQDGKTPVKGVDYFTESEVKAITADLETKLAELEERLAKLEENTPEEQIYGTYEFTSVNDFDWLCDEMGQPATFDGKFKVEGDDRVFTKLSIYREDDEEWNSVIAFVGNDDDWDDLKGVLTLGEEWEDVIGKRITLLFDYKAVEVQAYWIDFIDLCCTEVN